MYIRIFTEKEKQFIREKYVEAKWTAAKIGKELKAGVATVRKFLHEEKLIRPVGSSSRKYSSNFNYFKFIDTEQKAYWLGVLYADGCVSKKNNSLRFSSIDKEWIEAYKKDLEYNGPINIEHRHNFNKNIYKVTMYSERLVDSLISYGCVERKSLVLKFPDLPESLIPHFIRGYFDGDGCVYTGKYIRNSDCITLRVLICSGSKSLLEEMVKYLPIFCKLVRQRQRVHPIYEIVLSVKDSKAFYTYIYSKATRFLQRKKDKFDSFFQERGSTTIISPSYNR